MLEVNSEWDAIKESRQLERATFEAIHEAVAVAFGCDMATIRNREKPEPVARARNGFVMLCCLVGMRQKDVAPWLGRCWQAVQKSWVQAKNRHATDRHFRQQIRTAGNELQRKSSGQILETHVRMNINELKPNPNNPRIISDERLEALRQSLERFGDLSGIVFNRTTSQLVGGHQRVRIFRDAKEIQILIANERDKPDKQGTVATGFVRGDFGEFAYREVEWTPEVEAMANLAANKHGGEFDFEAVGKILKELDGVAPLNLTGFSEAELSELLKAHTNTEVQAPTEFDRKDENIGIQHQCPKCAYRWSGKPS